MANETNQRALSRGLRLGEAIGVIAVIIPLLIWIGTYQLKAHGTQVNHEDRIKTLEYQEAERIKKDEKFDVKLDEFQKSLNRIEVLLQNKADRK